MSGHFSMSIGLSTVVSHLLTLLKNAVLGIYDLQHESMVPVSVLDEPQKQACGSLYSPYSLQCWRLQALDLAYLTHENCAPSPTWLLINTWPLIGTLLSARDPAIGSSYLYTFFPHSLCLSCLLAPDM